MSILLLEIEDAEESSKCNLIRMALKCKTQRHIGKHNDINFLRKGQGLIAEDGPCWTLSSVSNPSVFYTSGPPYLIPVPVTQ